MCWAADNPMSSLVSFKRARVVIATSRSSFCTSEAFIVINLSSKQGHYGRQDPQLCLYALRSGVESQSQMDNSKRVNSTAGILGDRVLTRTLCFLSPSSLLFAPEHLASTRTFVSLSSSCLRVAPAGLSQPSAVHYSWALMRTVDADCLMATRHEPVFVSSATSAEPSPPKTAAATGDQSMERKQTALDQQEKFIFQ